MTEQTLIKYIVELYRASKRTGILNDRIKRGMQPAISSKVEDLFAHYLCSNFSNKWNYYIEYHLKSKDSEKTFLPDITIIHHSIGNEADDKILSFFDMKMDIGYSRNEFKDFCLKQDSLMESIKGTKAILSYGDEKFECEIPEDIKYNIVIITKTNINEEKFDSLLDELKDLAFIKVHFLTSGEHPNTKKIQFDELIKKIEINQNDFDKIHSQLEERYIENAIFYLDDEQIERLEEVKDSPTFRCKYFEINDLEEDPHYSYRMDKIFGNYWSHRTLRTLFDPYSTEYSQTTSGQKIEYLKKIIASGENLSSLLMEYEENYYNQNRKDIAQDSKEGVKNLLQKAIELLNEKNKIES